MVSATKMLEAKKRIFILGAGFSYHKTKILAKDYIDAIEKLSKKNSKRLGGYNPEKSAKRVIEFLRKEKFSRSRDLELLFSNIVNVCDKQGQTYPFQSSLDELVSVKNDLRFILREIFFDTQRDGQFTDEIIEFCSLLRKGDTFITFNYDCLLENTIYWLKYIKEQENVPVFNPLNGYGITFESDNIRDDIISTKKGQIFNRTNETEIEILKLHGSVNWSRNNNGRNICLYENTPNSPIRDCNKNQSGLATHDLPSRNNLWMIEPSYNKNIDEFIPLWQKAEQRISEANRIIIIGYSFPDADFNSRHIFQKSLRKTQYPKMQIIDPNAGMIKERIKKLIGDNINMWVCENKFEDWISYLSKKSNSFDVTR